MSNRTRSPLTARTVLTGLSLAAVPWMAFLLLPAPDRTDRSAWSEHACIADRVETYQYRDDRPHRQGGRGEMLTRRRTVCTERSDIGPVMPRGWKPDAPSTNG